MARICMKLEPIFWPSYQNGKGYEKIFQLIDSAIAVLVLEKPDEFLKRRQHIVEVLFKNHKETLSQQSPECSQQQPQQQQQRQASHHDQVRIKLKGGAKAAAGVPSLPVARNFDGKKIRAQDDSKKSATSSGLDQDTAFSLKLEATKFSKEIAVNQPSVYSSTAALWLSDQVEKNPSDSSLIGLNFLV